MTGDIIPCSTGLSDRLREYSDLFERPIFTAITNDLVSRGVSFADTERCLDLLETMTDDQVLTFLLSIRDAKEKDIAAALGIDVSTLYRMRRKDALIGIRNLLSFALQSYDQPRTAWRRSHSHNAGLVRRVIVKKNAEPDFAESCG